MTESDKINGWTFEETVKTAENLMEVEQNMFKWDVLRHLRDFTEVFREEIQQYRALGTVEELRIAKEKQIPKKPIEKVMPYSEEVGFNSEWHCPCCDSYIGYFAEGMSEPEQMEYCTNCGQHIAKDWSDAD